MSFENGLISIGPRDPQQISALASEAGFDVYIISTPSGTDASAFFQSVRSVLPLDPPLLSNDNWDALIDSLGGGIAELESLGVVIIWADALNLRAVSPRDFRVAMACLERVTEHVANPDWTDRPKQLSVFVNLESGNYSSDQWPYEVLGGGPDGDDNRCDATGG